MQIISPHCQLKPAQIERLENKVLIQGKLISPESRNAFSVIHSARMIKVCSQINCNEQDVDNAVQSALKAQKDWAKRPARQRGLLLRKGIQKLEEQKEEIAQLLTLETSKALRTESNLDIQACIDILDFYSGLGSELKGEVIPFRSDVLAYTVREPLGVVAAIIPWNVPGMLMAMKIGPALIAGNTVLVKSSEYAPLAVLRIAELLNEALPPGVLNLISGHGKPTGQLLVNHSKINKITFTGSVTTGKSIAQNAAQQLIPITLELGGKSPMIVCSDADLDLAVQGALTGMRFTRQGQSCSAASRIFLHQELYEAFVEKLSKKLDQLIIGDPFDSSVDVGAVACQMQYDKILSYLQVASGKNLKTYSSLPQDPQLKSGLFLQPTLLSGLSENHRAVQEEIFGPVTCLFQWTQIEDVIARANQTSFGLAATVWTQNLKTALRLTEELEAGFVQVNQNLVVQANLSYGGFKNSGLGKEASLEAMLEHFTKKKTVLIAK